MKRHITLTGEDIISVIIPVYNVEKYLNQCLQSVQTQTYSNLQVILVNDGSLDLSEEICLKYVNTDDRFTIIRKPNGGLASARNAGLDAVIGKYIACIDSDDWAEKTMIETMYRNLIEYEADMSVCGFYKENMGRTCLYSDFRGEKEILDIDRALEYTIQPFKYYGFSWNKMYKTNIVGKQRFDEKILKGEDSPFSCEYILKCRKIIYDHTPLYHYRCDSISISRSSYSKKKLTVLDSYAHILELLKQENKGDLVLLQKVQYDNQLLSLLVNIINSSNGQQYMDDQKMLINQMRKGEKDYLSSKDIDFIHKLAYICGCHFEALLKILVRIKKGVNDDT